MDKETQPVSVIVYAHGEPEDLRNNLPVLLNQDYPDYEVIVVNDGSDADSEDILKLFSNEYKSLYYTYVPVDTQYLSHKKLALTMGIKAARHDILLFTEADCRPISPKWIKAMVDSYNTETDIVLGFCAYRHTKGFLHKLIAYYNLTNGLQMISSPSPIIPSPETVGTFPIARNYSLTTKVTPSPSTFMPEQMICSSTKSRIPPIHKYNSRLIPSSR